MLSKDQDKEHSSPSNSDRSGLVTKVMKSGLKSGLGREDN